MQPRLEIQRKMLRGYVTAASVKQEYRTRTNHHRPHLKLLRADAKGTHSVWNAPTTTKTFLCSKFRDAHWTDGRGMEQQHFHALLGLESSRHCRQQMQTQQGENKPKNTIVSCQ